ncbi:MAG: hypothetical protein ACI4HO_10425 [Ruminococcus sp.]
MLKLAKRYLVFAIVFAMIYMIMPIFFQGENYKYDAIEYQFVFPATSLLGGLIYSWRHGMDFTFPLIAPIIYMGSAILYSHYYHWMIYVFIYLIVGMLGCFIGDMVYKNNLEAKRKEQRKAINKNNCEDAYKIKITNITVEVENNSPANNNQKNNK